MGPPRAIYEPGGSGERRAPHGIERVKTRICGINCSSCVIHLYFKTTMLHVNNNLLRFKRQVLLAVKATLKITKGLLIKDSQINFIQPKNKRNCCNEFGGATKSSIYHWLSRG